MLMGTVEKSCVASAFDSPVNVLCIGMFDLETIPFKNSGKLLVPVPQQK